MVDVKIPDKKLCRGECGLLRPMKDFDLADGYKDGHVNQCRRCLSEKRKRRYQEKTRGTKATVG